MTLPTSARMPGYLRLDEPDRDIVIMKFELEREDVMKFKPLYEAMFTFLYDEGYKHPRTNNEFIEDYYWERWTPSGAKEQHIWWRAQKKISPLIRAFLTINYQTLNVTKAEVAYQNKKVNAEKIDLIIRVELVMQWDYDDKFKNSFAWQFKRIFFNKMYVDEIEQKKKDLTETGAKLHRLIRGYFEMVMDGDTPVSHFPVMGYKEQ